MVAGQRRRPVEQFRLCAPAMALLARRGGVVAEMTIRDNRVSSAAHRCAASAITPSSHVVQASTCAAVSGLGPLLIRMA